MIRKEKHPAGWAELMYLLEDAQEHLSQMITDIQNDVDYGEGNFRVDLGHIYSHLNRAWHSRNATDGLSDSEWDSASKFPTDLEPV